MIVVNFYGGPGCGKSTIAASLFSYMKSKDISCEYVVEVAKRHIWDGSSEVLKCQPYIFGEQLKNIWMLKDKVDFAIVDSPLLLSNIYCEQYDRDWGESFYQYVIDTVHKFHNINFFMQRQHNGFFEKQGRIQTSEESKELDIKIHDYLIAHADFTYIQQHSDAAQVYNAILDTIKNKKK